MKKYREILVLLTTFIGLLLSGWFYFNSPSKKQNKQLEVILTSSNQKWSQERLKSGIEAAAKELKVDISYTEWSQEEFLDQATTFFSHKNKKDGIIIDGKGLDPKVIEDNKQLVNLELANFSKETPGISNSTDYKRGSSLGGYLKKRVYSQSVILYWQGEGQVVTTKRKQGLEKELAPFPVELVKGPIADLLAKIQQFPAKTDLKIIMDTPEQLKDFLNHTKEKKEKELACYLLEYSDKVRGAVDNEEVAAVVIQDDYSRGYQSVYQLVGPYEKRDRKIPENQILTQQNLFSEKLEPLIFPYND